MPADLNVEPASTIEEDAGSDANDFLFEFE